jgi:hypothetical protein
MSKRSIHTWNQYLQKAFFFSKSHHFCKIGFFQLNLSIESNNLLDQEVDDLK